MIVLNKKMLLLAGSVLAASFANAALAQEKAAAAEAAAEELIVTGSRLRSNPNETAPLPITTVDSAALRALGNSDPTATLRQIPALLASGTVADSLERGAGGVGQATLSLRQLGANRTLVLVDGWRHVSGVAGSQTVDVSTIPNALIERVDVLTGGASAVYGADAVTGVVNYVLKKNFEGLNLDAQFGISDFGDGQTYRIEGAWGRNFADGRGNITFAAGYTKDSEVLQGDRPITADNGRGNNSTTYSNPFRRFQQGDINAATMPNFANYYRVGGPGPRSSRISFGPAIPTAAQFATLFPGVTPSAAEQALIDRAANSPLFVIGRQPAFGISSNAGLIFRGDFARFTTDLNNNGVQDCNESYVGWTGFGGGGCYVSTAGNGVRIFKDGVISTSQNQFGGDGAPERVNGASLLPESQRVYANLRARYEFSSAAEVWIDAKYTRNTAISRNPYNTFYDTLLIFPENPFTPAALQAESDDAGGLRVSRDFTDLGDNQQNARRETYRLVAGLRGELSSHLSYEIVANYGRTDSSVTQANSVQYDRLFAAIDVVRGPNGQPVCRVNTGDSTPHPGSETFPFIAPGFFTFRPGDGTCVPANILGGANSISQAAVNWITTPTTDRFRLEQTVVTALFTGDTGGFLTLPGGAIQFSAGAEYREEKSSSTFSNLELGIIPSTGPANLVGQFIGDVSDNQQLIFDPSNRTRNAGGRFDVVEVFGEVKVPILKDMPFFHELTVGAAGRYADYSTIGGAFTWNVTGTWAPIPDIRFRGTYARAIRAPNITELFDPAQGATFRPADPCDLVNQTATANRRANCLAAATALGIANPATFLAGYNDPLTGRFTGTIGGNPDLTEEKATTWSVGTVIQPRFVPGLTLSADYYSIKIANAIATVTAQDIVNTCYDNSTFPNQFCSLFERIGPTTPGATSATQPNLFGFRTLNQSQLNFGRIETAGIDFSVNYRFTLWDKNNITLGVNGNWTEKVNRFFDPQDPNLVNPALRELSVPEWSGVGSVTYNRGAFTFGYNVQYVQSTAAAAAVQIERINTEFGPAGFAPDYWIHNLSFNVDVIGDRFSVYGGINNLTNAEPYIASSAYPVSGMGRFYFLGIRAKL
ncbi:TonB-dependent receptor [Sandarakinorhabdus sp. AAP62]|uniref:TonB-dependent receptor domain-containing protein n=1 Tax=Sandarakinorhabdus sp. AAP62 TaxID=1248916 RepID=UPI0002D952B3|nr:TonB-dependent receptor [Sandarakinorhabdus sp. AAP62]